MDGAQLWREPTASARIWNANWAVLALMTILAGIGIATLYSVEGGSFQPWAQNHGLRYLIGMALILWILLVPIATWRHLAYPFYGLALLLVILVPFAGVEALGARRWLDLAGLKFQPTEVMKLALVVALARYYEHVPQNRVSEPRYLVVPLLMILVPVAFTLRQPDLGSAILYATIGLSLLFLAGLSVVYFAAGGLLTVLAAPLVWSQLHDYQRRRVEVFLNPDVDPLGAGYHITQSKIALGAGGISGKGFMQGTQSQLDFLPEKHTDFIFTMFAEEWGFIGAIGLVVLFAILLALLLRIVLNARTPFHRLLAAGVWITIFLYVFINIAMVTGLMPVVGVPLPFVSYGGTSMLTLMTGVGLALAADVDQRLGERHRDRLRLGGWR